MKFTGIESQDYWIKTLGKSGKRFGYYELDLPELDIEHIKRNWDKRHRHITTRGFSILTKETLSVLTELLTGKNVLDVGCGTGYMVYHLRKNNIFIDGVVERKRRYGFKHNFMRKRLIKANFLDLDVSKYNAFIIGWPDYQSEDAGLFLDKLKSGDKVFYIGENWGDSCAEDSFFEKLSTEFDLDDEQSKKLNLNHVKFSCIKDYWEVYTKL